MKRVKKLKTMWKMQLIFVSNFTVYFWHVFLRFEYTQT